MRVPLFRRKHQNTPLPTVATGRWYRDDVPYALPKDLKEGDRLNLQHYLFRYALQGNYTAPLDGKWVRQILDVGSGTGIWGREMAQQYPAARVFGLDLEPPQTVSASATVAEPPHNYHFVQGNVLRGLPFPDQIFDYTHMRMLCAAIPDRQLPMVLRELVRVTRPGGYIELLELFALTNPGPQTKKAFDALCAFLGQRGMSLAKFEHLERLVKQAGFLTTGSHPLTIPIAWGKQVGELMEKDTVAGFAALQPRVCDALHIDPHTFAGWLEALPTECKKYRSSFQFSVVVAQVAGMIA